MKDHPPGRTDSVTGRRNEIKAIIREAIRNGPAGVGAADGGRSCDDGGWCPFDDENGKTQREVARAKNPPPRRKGRKEELLRDGEQ